MHTGTRPGLNMDISHVMSQGVPLTAEGEEQRPTDSQRAEPNNSLRPGYPRHHWYAMLWSVHTHKDGFTHTHTIMHVDF